MTGAPLISHPFCGACQAAYEVTIPAGSDAGQVLEALDAAADAHRETHAGLPVHIRRKIARKKGDSFYAVKYGADENGSKTLCGAPASQDISFADARSAAMLATVTCEQCRAIRAGASR